MIFIISTGTSGNSKCSSVRSWPETRVGSITCAML